MHDLIWFDIHRAKDCDELEHITCVIGWNLRTGMHQLLQFTHIGRTVSCKSASLTKQQHLDLHNTHDNLLPSSNQAIKSRMRGSLSAGRKPCATAHRCTN